MEEKAIRTRKFGENSPAVTQVGLGGEGILRTFNQLPQAQAVIREALDQGITYFDSARVYSDSEVYYGSIWEKSPVQRTGIFQASKSANRQKHGAEADLVSTLRRLKTDHLDLWQIHDVRTSDDFKQIGGPGGALEAFVKAKADGKIRNIGVTGHHDPAILSLAVKEWPVDSVMMPVNPVEGILGGFLTQTLPQARKKGIGVIAMKILGGGNYLDLKQKIIPELLIRYALSFDISVAIVGCSTPEEVKTLAEMGRGPGLDADERERLEEAFRPFARRLAFYRGVI